MWTSNTKTELGTEQKLNIDYIYVETPQLENNNNYKQLKSQPSKQARPIFCTETCTHVVEHMPVYSHTHTPAHACVHARTHARTHIHTEHISQLKMGGGVGVGG